MAYEDREFVPLSIPGMGTVYYSEVADVSPKYAFSDGQSRVSRTFLINWADRDRFVYGMLGYPQICFVRDRPRNTAPFDVYVGRVLPHSMVDFLDPTRRAPQWVDIYGDVQQGIENSYQALTNPHGTWLHAKSVESIIGLEPQGYLNEVTKVPEYAYALVTILYEPSTYRILSDVEAVDEHILNQQLYFFSDDLQELITFPNIDPNGVPARVSRRLSSSDPFYQDSIPYDFWMTRYITRTARPTIEFLALPRGLMRWVDPREPKPTVVDYASAVPTPSVEFVYTWHQVPFIPEAVYHHIGKVNQYDWWDGHQVFRAGTLMVLGADIKPYRMATGKFVVDVQYRLKYFEPFPDDTKPARGHNYFLRYKNDIEKLYFQKITSNGRGDALDGVNVNPGRPIFDYAPFNELFTWHVSEASKINSYKPEW